MDNIAFVLAAGDEQDGELRAADLAHGLHNLCAFHVGQVPVHDQQVKGFVPHVFQ
ncbi:hypothetical protein D3C71_1826590 [compost metagenome]